MNDLFSYLLFDFIFPHFFCVRSFCSLVVVTDDKLPYFPSRMFVFDKHISFSCFPAFGIHSKVPMLWIVERAKPERSLYSVS